MTRTIKITLDQTPITIGMAATLELEQHTLHSDQLLLVDLVMQVETGLGKGFWKITGRFD